MGLCHFIKDFSEKGHRGKDIGFIHQSDFGFTPIRGSVSRQLKGKFKNLSRPFPGNHHRIPCLPIRNDLSFAAGGKQPFGTFADQHKVDIAREVVFQYRRAAAPRGYRPHTGVEIKAETQIKLGGNLSPIVIAHPGQAHRT